MGEWADAEHPGATEEGPVSRIRRGGESTASSADLADHFHRAGAWIAVLAHRPLSSAGLYAADVTDRNSRPPSRRPTRSTLAPISVSEQRDLRSWAQSCFLPCAQQTETNASAKTVTKARDFINFLLVKGPHDSKPACRQTTTFVRSLPIVGHSLLNIFLSHWSVMRTTSFGGGSCSLSRRTY